MFCITFYFLFIAQFQIILCMNDVIAWTPDGKGYQITFPTLKEDGVKSSVVFELTSTSGKNTYKVHCEFYNSQGEKIEIYTSDGVFIDFSIKNHNGDKLCNEKYIKKMLIADDSSVEGKLRLIYLTSVKRRACMQRIYEINTWAFMAEANRLTWKYITCPPDMVESFDMLKGAGANLEADDDILIGPSAAGGIGNTMDYIFDLKERGSQEIKTFSTNNIWGKPFRFMCEEAIINKEDPETGKSSILIGSIELREGIILERFKLTTCSLESIKINQKQDPRFEKKVELE